MAFPTVADGRGYSAARLLHDQVRFMCRVGIDALEIDADHPSLTDSEAGWVAAVGEVNVVVPAYR